MEYYPQPRPVLYGITEEETPPPTQTAPVRIGPPRYPPAPPLAGDAPDPFNYRRGRLISQQSSPVWRGQLPDWWVGILYVLTILWLLVTSRSARTFLMESIKRNSSKARNSYTEARPIIIRLWLEKDTYQNKSRELGT